MNRHLWVCQSLSFCTDGSGPLFCTINPGLRDLQMNPAEDWFGRLPACGVWWGLCFKAFLELDCQLSWYLVFWRAQAEGMYQTGKLPSDLLQTYCQLLAPPVPVPAVMGGCHSLWLFGSHVYSDSYCWGKRHHAWRGRHSKAWVHCLIVKDGMRCERRENTSILNYGKGGSTSAWLPLHPLYSQSSPSPSSISHLLLIKRQVVWGPQRMQLQQSSLSDLQTKLL